MTGENEPDFITAQRKITAAREWRGDVNVTLGDETVTFKHRLLNEDEVLRVQEVLDLSEAAASEEDSVAQTDAQERLLELQSKDELSDEEEAEMQELASQVAAQTESIQDALGKEGFDVLMEMGRDTIRPSEEDIEYVYDADPREAKDILEVDQLPNPFTKGEIEELMTDKLASMITEQPYPIKMNVGMQAFSETISVLGNGLPSSE